MVEVAVMKTVVATAMAGGTYNNQLKGAPEEMMAAAMLKATETATVTETTKVTAMITAMTPKMEH